MNILNIDIEKIKTLQILYLHNNQIKEIPSVGLPQSLQIII